MTEALGRLIMKLGQPSGSRNERRRRQQLFTPAAAELLEVRSLLAAGPSVLTPTDAIVTDDQPEISWEAVDGAVSYDVWVADLDSRTVLFVEEGIVGTNFTPTTGLNQGRIRVWVRAKLGVDSYTDWGANYDFIVQETPTITGPVNTSPQGIPTKIDDTTPVITWDSAPGNWRFELFLSDQTNLTSTTWTIQNLTPVLDENGDPIPDGQGDVLREEIREFEVPTELTLGQYQAFIRATDDGGRVTEWSPAFDFEVAPRTEILRPLAPSFQNPPLLEWAAVPGATHYDVWVDGPGRPQLYREKYNVGTSFQIPYKLAEGDYTFWVQAINMTAGRPIVRGIWSEAAHFATLRRPVVNGPIGVEHNDPNVVLVTDPSPTITWTPIDKAVRYEVWVDRTQGPAEYVHTNTSVASYTFDESIDPGNYWVWVRALSSTGVKTQWSAPYLFTATGGAPVITSPTDNANTVALPTITWTPVAGAESYEIWVAQVDVDFDFLRVSGISETEFTPANPFNPGTYRLWVRAIGEDGTMYRWSESVTFVVADAEQPLSSPDADQLLAELPAPLTTRRDRDAAVNAADRSQSPQTAAAERTTPREPATGADATAASAEGPGAELTPAELLHRIAADGVLTEWWTENDGAA